MINVDSLKRQEKAGGLDRFHLTQLVLAVLGVAIMDLSSSNIIFGLGLLILIVGGAPIFSALLIALFVTLVGKPIVDAMPSETEFKVMRAKRNAKKLKEEVQPEK